MAAGVANLLNIEQGELGLEGWSIVQTYQVFTTVGTDTAETVLTAPGLPQYFDALSFDPLSRVKRLTPIKQEGSTKHWHVEVEFARESANTQDTQKPPTARPVTRSASIRWVEKALMNAREIENGQLKLGTDGKPITIPILTGAKTPINPPVTVQVPHPVVRFQRWEDSFTTATQDKYGGKVNSSQFGTYVAGRVLCTNIEAREEWDQNEQGDLQRYWNVTYEFEASQEFDSWMPFKILDADFWFIDPVDGERKPIYVDKNGVYGAAQDPADPYVGGDAASQVPVPSPVPLAGPPDEDNPRTFRGNVLQAKDLPDRAYYLEFGIYDTVDFNDLDLPVD